MITKSKAPTSKAEMYPLYLAGKFGNRLLTWPTLKDYLASDYPGLVVLRNRLPGGKWCAYGLTREGVIEQVRVWCQEGATEDLFTLNELAADDRLTFQGEIRKSTRGLYIRYSTLSKPMRKALAEQQQHAEGLQAVFLLRMYLDDVDYRFLMELITEYDTSDLDDPSTNVTLEFSVWDHKVGDWDRRMVVWEIRQY